MQLKVEEIYRQLSELDEHPSLEAKLCLHSLGDSIMETVCAFSNEPGLGGGYILLGANKIKKSLFENAYELVDLPHSDQLQLDLVSKCGSVFNQRVWPQIRTDVLYNKRLMTVFVPELPAGQKPLFFKDRALPGAAYRRSGSSDIRCRDEDIHMFYQDRGTETYDESIVSDATLKDIDPTEISRYRDIRRAVYPEAEELQYSDDELLIALGCAKPKGNDLCPTVAGILLFGTSLAFRRWFPLTRIEYLRVPGRKWIKEPDRRFTSLEIRGPLVRAIQRATTAILDDVMSDFSLPDGSLQRRDLLQIPEKVVREVVVNAVMHRCYRQPSAIQIVRFANRIEVRNPGYSLKSPEMFGQPGSQSRNPKIAAVLHELNIAETKGSGIRVMQRKMKDANLSPPYFESDRHTNTFVAYLVLQHFMSQSVIDWLTHFKDLNLSDDEAQALFFIREVGAIDSMALCMLTDTDQASATTSLHRLGGHGLLVPRGGDGHRWYSPTPALLDPARHRKKDRLPEAHSPDPKALGPDLAEQSRADDTDFSELPAEVRDRLPKIGPRSNKQTIERAILILCDWQPLMPAEIAGFLGRRSHERLVKDYLSPMVESDELERTIPDKPNSPRQKYKLGSAGARKLLG